MHRSIVKVIEDFINKDNSLRELSIVADDDFENLYGFDITPCCMPFNTTVWHNYVTPGVFLRCSIPCQIQDTSVILNLLNDINQDLPAGSFVLSSDGSFIIYKNSYYYSDGFSENNFQDILYSSKEFIGLHWEKILACIQGDRFDHQH